jgi:hypothetical protein
MTTKTREHITWTTQSEIKFIKGLCAWGIRELDRKELLKKYRKTVYQRDNWGGVDPDEIIAFLDGIN